MFNIVNTLHPAVVKEIVDHAITQRYDVKVDEKNEQAIMMSEHWKSELKSLPMHATVSALHCY